MLQKGAKIIIDCLIEQGVDYVFGYPGGQIIDTFDELYQARDKITQILTAHEQGAAHAAEGYDKVTGRPGVVIATSGPGATNLVTGIADAYMDSVPMVAITGNVPTCLLGRDSFQEVDIAGITMPITKHNYIVKDITTLADTIREAFYIAKSGRPGPVLIDVPKNIQQGMCEYTPAVPKEYIPKFDETQSGIDEIVDIITSSSRPLLYIGGGIISAGASEALVKFAEKYDIPVASSLMALGAMDTAHPLYLGMIGMHGFAGVASSVKDSDTIICIGARFSDRVATDRNKFGKGKNLVHIDIDNAEINKNVAVGTSIKGDAKLALECLTKKGKAKKNADWVATCRAYIDKFPLKRCGTDLCAREVLRSIRKQTPKEQVVVTDVGQHQMWTAQTFDWKLPRTFLTSGGLGTMGFGFGASIGACIASGKQTIMITGDGSFHMNLNEFATAVKLNLPIVIFLMNNNTLGMVRQWQTLFYGKRYSSTDLNLHTNYIKLAEAFGAKGLSLDKDSDIDAVVAEALSMNGPVIVDCRIETNSLVLPMVPPGMTTDELITDLDLSNEK